MRIAVMSDNHGILPQIRDENIELLLICGDIVPLSFQNDVELTKWWFDSTFREWAENLPVEKVVFIAGNHDLVIERDPDWFKVEFPKHGKVTYLHHELYEYISSQDGAVYSIFGTPYCKIFGRWAFMRDSETLEKLYNEIPENLDILISHDSPLLGGLGFIHQSVRWGNQEAGNGILADVILEKKPKYFFSGHIHSGTHQLQEIDEIKLANVSIVDEYYDNVYRPLILDI